jgi:hypothetical protein
MNLFGSHNNDSVRKVRDSRAKAASISRLCSQPKFRSDESSYLQLEAELKQRQVQLDNLHNAVNSAKKVRDSLLRKFDI